MKILAMEQEMEGVKWDNSEGLLQKEAQQVYQLYLANCIREIYFTEKNIAILILETKDRKTAMELLNTLPLVANNMIRFDIMELNPYAGYKRIMRNKI